jgi:hypothetical protein
MSVLVDRRGNIRWIHRGFNTGDAREYSSRVRRPAEGNLIMSFVRRTMKFCHYSSFRLGMWSTRRASV